MKNSRFFCFFLLLSPLFLSCSSDDGEPQDPSNTNSDGFRFTVRVNDMDFEGDVEDFLNALVTIQNNGYTISFTADDVINQNTVQTIGLGMLGTDFEALGAGQVWTEIPLDADSFMEAAVGSYALIDTSDTENNVGTMETIEIMVRLTAIDRDNRLMSGEFSFTAMEEDSQTIFTVTDGVFTNIPYIIEGF